jgi:hypothetical protein
MKKSFSEADTKESERRAEEQRQKDIEEIQRIEAERQREQRESMDENDDGDGRDDDGDEDGDDEDDEMIEQSEEEQKGRGKKREKEEESEVDSSFRTLFPPQKTRKPAAVAPDVALSNPFAVLADEDPILVIDESSGQHGSPGASTEGVLGLS